MLAAILGLFKALKTEATKQQIRYQTVTRTPPLAQGQDWQDYDIMGWTKDDIIVDIINQYERHRHFLHMVHDNEPIPDDK